MFFYEGYSCPVCQKTFDEADDIVTCPDCGAPHHRACWKQYTHCFFLSKHNTSEQWSRENAQTTPTAQENVSDKPEKQVCARCGTENSAFAEFCSRCGNELDAEDWEETRQETSPFTPPNNGDYREYRPFSAMAQDVYVTDDTDLDGVKAGDMRTFVGQNAHYYLPRFVKMCKQNSSFGWNWAAFLLTPYWLWYRKQYLYGTLVLLFELLQTCCTSFFMYGYLGATTSMGYTDLVGLMQQNMTDPVFLRWEMVILLCSFIQLFIRFFFGIVGNYLYFRVAKKRILRNSTNSITSASALARSGGVSFVFGAVAYAILYFASTFANLLFM